MVKSLNAGYLVSGSKITAFRPFVTGCCLTKQYVPSPKGTSRKLSSSKPNVLEKGKNSSQDRASRSDPTTTVTYFVCSMSSYHQTWQDIYLTIPITLDQANGIDL
jgi:hypothetical protein